MSDLKKLKDEFLSKLRGKLNLSEVNQIKSELFGKNGLISTQFKKIGTIAESEKKKFASDLNIIKDELQSLINSKINEAENTEINKKLEQERIDITLPLADILNLFFAELFVLSFCIILRVYTKNVINLQLLLKLIKAELP